jgi:hypothetical protein
VKERPILFSGDMVRALLDGRKTVTRRIVMPQPSGKFLGLLKRPLRAEKDEPVLRAWFRAGEGEQSSHEVTCPYGQTGDILWVRETFVAFGRWETRFSEEKGRDEWHFVDMTLETGRAYRYDGALPNAQRGGTTPAWWKRPSIFMPRAAARIALEVTGVRVERLQDISEVDAIAEGIRQHDQRNGWVNECQLPDGKRHFDSSAYGMFRQLWDSLNAARGCGFDVNPWVWCISFKRIES